MKIYKANKRRRMIQKLMNEDMRLLQRKVSGRNVYGSITSAYRRAPKHRRYVLQDEY